MARAPLNSESVKVEQLPPIDRPADYDGDIVLVDQIRSRDFEDELAFMEEPVTIILQPSTDKNASTSFPIWVNGKPAEVFQRGKWEEIGYLPVGVRLTVKRKVLEVIIRAKVTSINTHIINPEAEQPENRVGRFTSPVH